MIRIDSRVGSKELEPLFLAYGIRAEKTTLDYGDFDFEGNGPNSRVAICFERKQLSWRSVDLAESMFTDRLNGHQLPGMADRYDYAYLIIEGVWRHGAQGELEIPDRWGNWKARQVPARAIVNFTMALAIQAGVIPWRSMSPIGTVAFIVDQYRWWQKRWHEHGSTEVVYAPADPRLGMGIHLNPRKASFREKVIMQTPGLDEKARWAAKYFKSAREAANASAEEWANVTWETRTGKVHKLGLQMGRKLEAIWGSEL
jgi:ERCC4-type nuclease